MFLGKRRTGQDAPHFYFVLRQVGIGILACLQRQKPQRWCVLNGSRNERGRQDLIEDTGWQRNRQGIQTIQRHSLSSPLRCTGRKIDSEQIVNLGRRSLGHETIGTLSIVRNNELVKISQYLTRGLQFPFVGFGHVTSAVSW